MADHEFQDKWKCSETDRRDCQNTECVTEGCAKMRERLAAAAKKEEEPEHEKRAEGWEGL